MLLKTNRLLPYPILSPDRDDYRDIIFSLGSIQYTLQPKVVTLIFSIILNDILLSQFIDIGGLKLFLHTECPQTKYRDIHFVKIGENSLSIPNTEINGKLEIVAFLIANDIKEYTHPNLDEFYKSIKFDFPEGSIFGNTEVWSLIVTKENEALHNVQSIMSIIKQENAPKENITVDFDTREKIIIKAHPNVYQYYYSYKNNKGLEPLVFSSIIIPALIEVLAAVKDTVEDQTYATKKWYRVLDKSLEKRIKYGLEKSLFDKYQLIEIAQAILEYPLGNAFKNITNIIDR